MTADATPDDEAAWEAWAESTPLTYDPEGPVHLGFVAGRVSGRADAAAQALDEAADLIESDRVRNPEGRRLYLSEWQGILRNLAAQYREKGTPQ